MLKEKYLIDLLPYDPNVKIFDGNLQKRILAMSLVIFNELIETIKHFYFKKDFSFFDPHVGENLCQIRACQLLDLFFDIKNIPSDEIKIEKSMQIKVFEEIACRIENLLQNDSPVIELTHTLTVRPFIDDLKLNVIISHGLCFLMLSHFLTKYRKFNELENTIIDYSKLTSKLNASKNITRRIIHQYQIQLSQYSYNYVFNNAILHKAMNINILKLLQHLDDDGRYTLPCFLVMDILLINLKDRKNTILFVVRHEKSANKKLTTLLYVYNRTSGNYFLCSNPSQDILREPCFVIHGINNDTFRNEDHYIANFDKIGVHEVIMANMASHPQYSGKKLAALKQNPFIPLIASSNAELSSEVIQIEKKFILLKKKSEEIGCSGINPTLLHIRHMFCDRLDHQLQRVNNDCFYSTDELLLLETI